MMSTAWSWYVIALVAIVLLGCLWLLWWTARRRPGDPAPEDTSHVWDGDLTEYNKPLPRWWINLFYLTILFAFGYIFWFGGLGRYQGYSKWSSQKEYATEKAADDLKLEETFRPFKGQSIDMLAKNPAAVALGRNIFNNTCATCHGSSAQGAVGYPNLADNIWKWGDSPERILETILDGREGVMPEWGTALTGMGGPNAVDYTVAYVRTLSNPESIRNDYLAAQGKPLYDGICVACHGADGKGNQQLGASDLTDDYWLYGNSKQALHASIAKGRHGSMPAHRELLGETRSRLVGSYVWWLSHQQDVASAQTTP